MSQTFEEALNRLREIVQQLEAGNLPLEKMLELYEEGRRLSEFCEKKLQEARQRIERLQGASASEEATGESDFR